MKEFIPIYQPLLDGNEKKYVNECLDSTWISSKGKFISEFETEFAHFAGTRFAATCTNGTVALHLALLALGVGDGDEVIVPTFTYISPVNAISYVGATPIFIDSLEDTWQLDPEQIKQKISPKTKAIIVVHLYGHPAAMDGIIALAKEKNLAVIEDCAEAIGSKYKGKDVGTFGDIATFSLFGNKTITSGEGGVVTTNREDLHDLVMRYKGQGLATGREYWHDLIGYNYRMTNICAALGLAQLERIESFLSRKQRIAQRYQDSLKHLPVEFHGAVGHVKHSFWMCSILVPKAEQREALRKHLKDRGIETRPTFFPIHLMPMYSHFDGDYPVAASLSARGINLPSWPGLKDEQVDYITESIGTFLEGA